jgi:hypothetical protein
MTRFRIVTLTSSVGLARLISGAVLVLLATAPARADKCGGAKLKAIGKQEAGLLSCQAKVATTNDSSGLAACEGKAMTTFSTAFGKAGTCGGDETTCGTRASTCETAIASAMTETFPSKCEAAKRKAAGKLAQGELGCYEKAAATGVALDPACISKATSKFTTALGKAGTCADGGSPLSLVENKCVTPSVTTDTGGMVNNICPPCGTFLLTFGWGVTRRCKRFRGLQFQLSAGNLGRRWRWGVLRTYRRDGRWGRERLRPRYWTRWSRARPEIHEYRGIRQQVGHWGHHGGGVQLPNAITVDGSGNVFVADEQNQRVQKFDNNGTFLLTFGWGVKDGAAVFETCTSGCQAGIYGSGDGEFGGPEGIAVDGSGNVFVSEVSYPRVQEFTNTGVFVTKWGNMPGVFSFPLGVGVDGSGNVFVADNGNNLIQEFTHTGTHITMWPVSVPEYVAVDGSGNVLVTTGDSIQKFTNTGTSITNWGSMGNGDGQFAGAYGLVVDGGGNVFVTDISNHRVQKFACP